LVESVDLDDNKIWNVGVAFDVAKNLNLSANYMKSSEKYVTAGNYYWNSGMFAFKLGFLWQELSQYEPAITDILAGGYEKAVANFASMPDI